MYLIIRFIFLISVFFNFSLNAFEVYKSVQSIIEKEEPNQDADNDGILDYKDNCPDSFIDSNVNEYGCPVSSFIVLLPNSKSKNAIFIENEMGSIDIDKEYNYTMLALDEEPSKPKEISKAKIDEMFPFINDNIYKKATHYTLYFNNTTLTRSSKVKMKTLVRDIKSRLNPIISIYGHTDTVGKSNVNFDLSIKRATKIKLLIDKKDLNYLKINLRPMGENDLKIKTKDEVSEPRNKRVEILIQ